MPAELRLTQPQWASLVGHLLQDHREHAAVLLCAVAHQRAGAPLLVCRDVVPLGDDVVLTGSDGLHLEVSPIALARIAKRARATNLTMVVCHSHPFGGAVHPSPIDLITEEELCGRVLSVRLGHPVGGLVVGPDGASLRLWEGGHGEAAGVRVVGRTIVKLGVATSPTTPSASFDRQVRLWGDEGQSRIAEATFVVVGLGGTGSIVAAQLAHLGARRMIFIDPDSIEPSNLSRIVGASLGDVGQPKVSVAAAMVRRVNASATIEVHQRSVLEIDPSVLLDADVIVCCTDGHGSRHLLTEAVQQFIVPVVDMGIEIQPGNYDSRAGGGVRVLLPGRACLHCMGVLDGALVREEFLPDDELETQRRLGYLRSGATPAPAVIALNGVVASLAVVEVCNLLTGVFPESPQRVVYAAERRSVRTVGAKSTDGCYVCGKPGLLGLGGNRPLPRRPARAG